MAATSSGQTTVPRPRPDFKQTPTAKTGDFTLLAATCAGGGKIYTNTGAGATVVFTLPAAADMAGSVIGLKVTAAQIVRALPVTGEKIFLHGDGVATKYLNVAATIGNYVELYSDGVDWTVEHAVGVVTKEA
jgi:hypothetical protein